MKPVMDTKREYKKKELSRPIAFIFFIAFVGFGVLALFIGINTLKNAYQSKWWPTVEGIVISSEVGHHHDHNSSTYKAQVLYDYKIEGSVFSSNTVSFGQYSSGNPRQARRIVNRYPKEKLVKVYYNPNNPEVSCLEPGASWSSYILLLFGALFASIGLAFSVALFKMPTKVSDPFTKV
jgi:hypothetical protein